MPYQDKQLKKEFITLDNRTIPFGYPQFWGGDDWEVSGRDNPLPVANYTQNEQGLWVPVSNVNPVPTQLTGSNAEELSKRYKPIDTLTYQRSGELAGGGTSEILVDLPNVNCELQSFSLGTNYHSTQVRISFYKEDGTLDGHLMLAKNDGTGLSHPTPNRIHIDSNGENDFWKLQVYDIENNQYVITMKRPLKCLNGLRITIFNYAQNSYNVAVNAAIARMEG